ncbi:MAG: hypothetical protein KGQ41_01920 [Alphaproteobacteria bacterium]|nr:hypothetical protein [Alphaproteobacteria bacterium]
MNKTLKILVFTALLFTTASASAFADDKGRGHGKDKHESKHYSREYRFNDDDDDGRYWRRSNNTVILINADNRDVIRQYIYDDYRGHCPPGLAKKHNGCVPPGHTRYVVGQILPPDVVYYPVPSSLLVRLDPVPVGYQYVRVDKDVLLISEATKKVIDAVTLLSAVDG